MEPVLIHGVYDEKRLSVITEYFRGLVANVGIRTDQRTMFDSVNNRILQMLGQELLPLARQVFQCENLLSTKTTFAHYEGHQGVLGRHVDLNPNVKLIDVCIYEDVPWGIVVEGKEYIFPINSAVAFHSGKLEHWRNPNPDLENNKTGVLLAYFDEMQLNEYSRPVGESLESVEEFMK